MVYTHGALTAEEEAILDKACYKARTCLKGFLWKKQTTMETTTYNGRSHECTRRNGMRRKNITQVK